MAGGGQICQRCVAQLHEPSKIVGGGGELKVQNLMRGEGSSQICRRCMNEARSGLKTEVWEGCVGAAGSVPEMKLWFYGSHLLGADRHVMNPWCIVFSFTKSSGGMGRGRGGGAGYLTVNTGPNNSFTSHRISLRSGRAGDVGGGEKMGGPGSNTQIGR